MSRASLGSDSFTAGGRAVAPQADVPSYEWGGKAVSIIDAKGSSRSLGPRFDDVAEEGLPSPKATKVGCFGGSRRGSAYRAPSEAGAGAGGGSLGQRLRGASRRLKVMLGGAAKPDEAKRRSSGDSSAKVGSVRVSRETIKADGAAGARGGGGAGPAPLGSSQSMKVLGSGSKSFGDLKPALRHSSSRNLKDRASSSKLDHLDSRGDSAKEMHSSCPPGWLLTLVGGGTLPESPRGGEDSDPDGAIRSAVAAAIHGLQPDEASVVAADMLRGMSRVQSELTPDVDRLITVLVRLNILHKQEHLDIIKELAVAGAGKRGAPPPVVALLIRSAANAGRLTPDTASGVMETMVDEQVLEGGHLVDSLLLCVRQRLMSEPRANELALAGHERGLLAARDARALSAWLVGPSEALPPPSPLASPTAASSSLGGHFGSVPSPARSSGGTSSPLHSFLGSGGFASPSRSSSGTGSGTFGGGGGSGNYNLYSHGSEDFSQRSWHVRGLHNSSMSPPTRPPSWARNQRAGGKGGDLSKERVMRTGSAELDELVGGLAGEAGGSLRGGASFSNFATSSSAGGAAASLYRFRHSAGSRDALVAAAQQQQQPGGPPRWSAGNGAGPLGLVARVGSESQGYSQSLLERSMSSRSFLRRGQSGLSHEAIPSRSPAGGAGGAGAGAGGRIRFSLSRE